MANSIEHTRGIPSASLPAVLDEAIQRLAERLNAVVSEQKELEMSLMSLKELRANVGELPDAATRALMDVMRLQAGGQAQRRLEVGHTIRGAIITDDEDGPACAEPLSPAESLTNYEKIVQYFLSRKNQPATNMDIRATINASRGAVAQILYTSQADKFERLKEKLSGKVAWRLRKEIYQRAELEAYFMGEVKAASDRSDNRTAGRSGPEEDIPF